MHVYVSEEGAGVGGYAVVLFVSAVILELS